VTLEEEVAHDKHTRGDGRGQALVSTTKTLHSMPAVLSKPLYFASEYTLLQDEIHTLKDKRMNVHWWIKCGSVIIDPTPALPPPEFAVSERLYFPFNKEDTAQRWGELLATCTTYEDVDLFLTELAQTKDFKLGKCYWNALATWRPRHPPYAPMGELVCGAVGYKVEIPENLEYYDSDGRLRSCLCGRYVSLDYGY
jgi:hypothetical protein